MKDFIEAQKTTMSEFSFSNSLEILQLTSMTSRRVNNSYEREREKARKTRLTRVNLFQRFPRNESTETNRETERKIWIIQLRKCMDFFWQSQFLTYSKHVNTWEIQFFFLFTSSRRQSWLSTIVNKNSLVIVLFPFNTHLD